MTAPLLISLPHGLNTSGVTMWAVRLVNALAARGRACGLVVHDVPPGQRPISPRIRPGVEVIDAGGLPPLDACAGDLSSFLPVYRMALGILATRATGPVVCSPNLLGDSYGLFAELSRTAPELVRVIAVHHSDLRYNDLICEHYEPMISAFVGVSERITSRLRSRMPRRSTDVYGVPYGVEVGDSTAPRPPLAGRPVRLLYTGRIDHEQKRIGALVAMSDELARIGILHELVLLGDGPAAGEIDGLCAIRQMVRRHPATDPDGVERALDMADLFVLASRYEGLSVSLLEALGHGCVPVLTPSASGTSQLVEHGRTGFIANAGPDASPADAGIALAGAVNNLLADPAADGRLATVRDAGWSNVRSLYSVQLCAARYGAIIDRAAASPARPWPAHTAAAFTGSGGGSATVPHDAAGRLAALLQTVEGRRLAIYGAGRHTIELREALARAEGAIVAFIDDDPARQGGALWGVPIIPPERAVESGATDVIISSWLHQDVMWRRSAAMEHAGLRVHRIYEPAASSNPQRHSHLLSSRCC